MKAVKRPRFDKAFDCPLIHFLAGEPFNKIFQILKQTVFLPLGDDCLDHRLSNTFDCCKPIADIAIVHRELSFSFIDVRRKNFYSHLPAGINIFCHFSRIVNNRRHKRRHKFYRIVIFQICSLISDNRIGRRMRLVKCIFCKINHLIINLIGNLFTDSVCNTSRNPFRLISIYKVLALFLHHIALFLGHRTAHQVASSKCIPSQIPHNLHNLLLIHNTSIRRFQNRFQLWTIIGDRIHIIFPFDILWDKIHRSRTIQRNSRNNILQTLRL